MNQTVMKLILIAFALFTIFCISAMCVSAGHEFTRLNQEFRDNLTFEKGDLVNLKLGGKGQILKVSGVRTERPYLVRTLGESGIDCCWMREWELVTP